MGNIISNDQNIQSPILKAYINEWANEKYSGGMEDTNVGDITIYKNLLKKRACCTNQNLVALSFPTAKLETNNTISGLDATIPNLVTPIKLQALTALNEANCQFDGNDYYLNVQGNTFTTTQFCKTLYNGNNNNGFCNKVKIDRERLYNTNLQQSYGPYPFIRDGLNTNRDCNCTNSLLRENLQTIDDAVANKSGAALQNFDEETAVQNFDKRCTSLGYNSFKPEDRRNTNLCVNITNIQNADISGTLDTRSSCSMTNTGGNNPATDNTATDNPAVDNNTSNSTNNILDISKLFTSSNGIIISSGVAFLIVFLILIKLFI